MFEHICHCIRFIWLSGLMENSKWFKFLLQMKLKIALKEKKKKEKENLKIKVFLKL